MRLCQGGVKVLGHDKTSAVATTGLKWSTAAERLARDAAARLGIPYVQRGRQPLPEMRAEYGVDYILVAKQGQLKLEMEGGELFFHPNMAHLRLKNLRIGKGDRMVEALGLQRGMSVLDCTLGLGADAIVESFAVGPEGSVMALESEPLIEVVISYGLAHALADNWPMQEAMRGIRTACTEALAYLQAQPDDAVDVIYFDPMFRHPLNASKGLAPLRRLADPSPVSPEVIKAACRVARRRVVLKENARSLEFERLGFPKIAGGRYSKVHYGVMEL